MNTREVADIAIGTGAVTHPAWLETMNAGAQEVVLIGGAALVVFRLVRMFVDWRNAPITEDEG